MQKCIILLNSYKFSFQPSSDLVSFLFNLNYSNRVSNYIRKSKLDIIETICFDYKIASDLEKKNIKYEFIKKYQGENFRNDSKEITIKLLRDFVDSNNIISYKNISLWDICELNLLSSISSFLDNPQIHSRSYI